MHSSGKGFLGDESPSSLIAIVGQSRRIVAARPMKNAPKSESRLNSSRLRLKKPGARNLAVGCIVRAQLWQGWRGIERRNWCVASMVTVTKRHRVPLAASDRHSKFWEMLPILPHPSHIHQTPDLPMINA